MTGVHCPNFDKFHKPPMNMKFLWELMGQNGKLMWVFHGFSMNRNPWDYVHKFRLTCWVFCSAESMTQARYPIFNNFMKCWNQLKSNLTERQLVWEYSEKSVSFYSDLESLNQRFENGVQVSKICCSSIYIFWLIQLRDSRKFILNRNCTILD